MTNKTPEETDALRTPVRPPKQARSQRTLDRIALAALDLMEEGGVENATVAGIV